MSCVLLQLLVFLLTLLYSDALMEECVRMMQQTLRASPTMKKRAKSVYTQRNLGTIKERKKEKREEKEVSNGETIMRILRMRYLDLILILRYKALTDYFTLYRPGTSDFIAQQLQIMTAMQQEQEQRAKETADRKLQRPSNRQSSQVPPVPPLPGQA